MAPITRSECPFQNFVRGSMEMSTPQSNGFPKNGDPQALSAATKILFWRAIAEIDGTSIISNVIVPGLSRYIILVDDRQRADRSEAHKSELQSLMRTSYAVFCLKTKKRNKQ